MKIEFAFLARTVEPAIDGTLHILGADLGRVRAHAFPTVIPSVTAVVKFVTAGEPPMRLKYRIDGPDGPIFTSGDSWIDAMELPDTPASGGRSGARLTLSTPPLLLTGPGTYTLSIGFEAAGEVKLPLEVLGPDVAGES